MFDLKNLSVEEQITLDDMIHDAFSKKASTLNNGGPEVQIAFLVSEGWSEDSIAIEIGEGTKR